MPEIANFVRNGASKITPKTLKSMLSHVAMLKLEFTQVKAPLFPHLIDQLEFLADVVEDFAEGKLEEMPFMAIAYAAFAIMYAHKKTDLIPDFIPHYGHADDSAVVRATLIEYEPHFIRYANLREINWNKITLNS